jgi:hypothetical protein
MLRIADLEFPIVSCLLKTYCGSDETLLWIIEVECGPHASGELEGYAPNLELNLFQTTPGEMQHWWELAPREASWVEKNDNGVTPSGMLRIFEHTLLFESQARLLQANGEMQINLAGQCDVHFNERYGRNLPLALDAAVKFDGIWLGRAPEMICYTLIDPFLDFDDFQYSQTERGVSVLKPRPPKMNPAVKRDSRVTLWKRFGHWTWLVPTLILTTIVYLYGMTRPEALKFLKEMWNGQP